MAGISEDSSEIAFLLVENYTFDRSSWSSDRGVIFDTHHIQIPIIVSLHVLGGPSLAGSFTSTAWMRFQGFVGVEMGKVDISFHYMPLS